MNEWHRFVGWLRNWERRYYHSDYAESERRNHWLTLPETLPAKEVRFPVRLSPEDLKSVLVFKPDDMGDVVQSLPALLELRKALPDTRISVIVQERIVPLIEKTGVADTVLPVQVGKSFRRFPKVVGLPTLEADLAIFLRTHPAYFSHFLKLKSRKFLHARDPRMKSHSPYQVYVNPTGERGEHQALQMLRLVSPITGKSYGYEGIEYPAFSWSPSDQEEVAKHLNVDDPFIVLHPHAKDETRRYPEGYWKELISTLAKEFPVKWVSIGTADEKNVFSVSPTDESALSERVCPLEGKLSLSATGYLISKARAFIGNSSGPAHLAAAQGIPTITLIGGGASYPREWGPLGKSLLLSADVPCAPCNLRACPGKGLVCLTELTPEKVATEVIGFLIGWP